MAPKFPKPKDEGWFLILGDVENRELLALKRVPFVGARGNQTLAFQTPEAVSYTLWWIIGFGFRFDHDRRDAFCRAA